jgi:methionyl-tRNA formyltransferase
MNDYMKVVFFGASDLGYKCCRRVLENKAVEVVGIFTIPREFNISYSEKPVRNVLYKDFHELGKEFDVPVIEVNGSMSSYVGQLKELAPDFMLVIGWYFMIPDSMIKLAPLGCAGIHASLLPKYRGGAPLVWAIINGEAEAGISFFYFDSGVDTGDIVAQEKIGIEGSDTIRDLLYKTTKASLSFMDKYIPLIAKGKAPRIKQDYSMATQFPQRSPEDGQIDWSCDEKEIYNFVRAQTMPYPGAFTIWKTKKLSVWKVTYVSKPVHGKPGEVLQIIDEKNDAGVVVATGKKGAVILKEVQMDGEEFLSADVYAKKNGLKVGDILE